MVNSRDKGKRGELEARDQIRELWNCPKCVRAAQVSGTFAADLLGGPAGLHLEVKRYAKIAAMAFMEQAVRDSKGLVPVVLMRENDGDWVMMVRLQDSVGFCRKLLEHLNGEQASG